MANTSWSTTDKGSANIVLSGSNLIATVSTGPLAGGLRSADRLPSGSKFYFEVTFNTASNQAVGIATAAANVAQGASWANAAVVYYSGLIYINNTSSGVNVGAFSAGQTACVAVDLTTYQIWFRNGAAGNWNANAGYSPATGVGGQSLGSFATVAFPLYAYAVFNNSVTSSAFTANFGDTAFTGTVPSGFTSGFTSGTSVPVNEVTTQAAAEVWGSTNPAMQVTQAAAEVWARSNVNAQLTQAALEQWYTTNPAGQLTQAVMEHWATVATQTPVTTNAFTIIMG